MVTTIISIMGSSKTPTPWSWQADYYDGHDDDDDADIADANNDDDDNDEDSENYDIGDNDDDDNDNDDDENSKFSCHEIQNNFSGLEEEAQYELRLRAMNRWGASSYSEEKKIFEYFETCWFFLTSFILVRRAIPIFIMMLFKFIFRQGWSGLSEPFHFRTAGQLKITLGSFFVCLFHYLSAVVTDQTTGQDIISHLCIVSSILHFRELHGYQGSPQWKATDKWWRFTCIRPSPPSRCLCCLADFIATINIQWKATHKWLRFSFI